MMTNTSPAITTCLMFSGKAEEAINFYTSLFDDGVVTSIFHHNDGTVMFATYTLKGQMFMAMDNANRDEHPFTPAMSLFVSCDSEEEIERVFQKLSEDGTVLMPLTSYPFSKKFAWVEDKYGVSWQLNLAAN